jgi:hypothetical protein
MENQEVPVTEEEKWVLQGHRNNPSQTDDGHVSKSIRHKD